MSRRPVEERPFLSRGSVALQRALTSLFADYGQALNDDLLVRPDWTRTITAATYTMLDTDRFLLVDATAAPITITLPPVADTEPRLYGIKRINSGANAVTVDPNASETIDGVSANRVLSSQWDHLCILSDRAAWFQIAVSGAGTSVFSGAAVTKTTAEQNLTDNGSSETITWDTEVYDVGGWFADGGDETIFTVPSGVARVSFMAQVRVEPDGLPNVAAFLDVFLKKTPVDFSPRPALRVPVVRNSGTNVTVQIFSGVTDVTVGDELFVNVAAGQYGADPAIGAVSCYMSVQSV